MGKIYKYINSNQKIIPIYTKQPNKNKPQINYKKTTHTNINKQTNTNIHTHTHKENLTKKG